MLPRRRTGYIDALQSDLMQLALGIDTGAQLHQPLAIAVIGGFCTALPLLLLIFPGLLRLAYEDESINQ